MTLKEYATKKFNNRNSLSGCLNYMIKSSFFSKTFREFWTNWNPLWSYFLIFYSYKPMRKVISKAPALILTFVVSGFLHDLFVMLLLQKIYFLFSLIFLLIGIFTLTEQILKINLKGISKYLRPLYHCGIIIICTFIGLKIYG